MEEAVVGIDRDITERCSLLLVDYRGYVCDDADVVGSDYRDVGYEFIATTSGPTGRDDSIGIAVHYVRGIRTITTVDLDDAFGGNKTEYVVAVDRVAAF